MSSTHVHARKVLAAQNENNETFFFMLNKACSSNVYPRTPSWACIGSGNLETCFENVFTEAYYANDGMLRGAGGRRITDKGTIRAWLKLFAQPCSLHGAEFHLSPDVAQAVETCWEDMGKMDCPVRSNIVQQLKAGRNVSLNIQEADVSVSILAELVPCVYTLKQELAGIAEGATDNDIDTRLAYTPKRVKSRLSFLGDTVYVTDHSDRLGLLCFTHDPEQLGSNPNLMTLSHYRYARSVEKYIALGFMELAEPGNYSRWLDEWEIVDDAALPLPEQTSLLVRTDYHLILGDSMFVKAVDLLLEALKFELTADAFKIKYADLKAKEISSDGWVMQGIFTNGIAHLELPDEVGLTQ